MAMFSSSERLWNESERLRWDERNETLEAPWQDEGERNYYAMLYSLLILAIVFGNVLVCLAVLRERSLQTTTNYLVVSLAVSDLLVASLVMPWAVYLEVSVCIYILQYLTHVLFNSVFKMYCNYIHIEGFSLHILEVEWSYFALFGRGFIPAANV